MRRKGILVLWISLAVVAFVFARTGLALDPSRSIDQYTMRTWALDEGFPQTSANAIVQAPDGYLYVATFGGLIRFDGVLVTVIPTDGSCSNRLFSLEVDGEGNLWVGTERSGLCRLDDGVLRAFAVPGLEEIGGVSVIRQARDGDLWVGSVGGILRISDSGIQRLGVDEGLPSPFVSTIDEGRGGAIWVGTEKGICVVNESRCEVVRWNDALGGAPVEVIRHTEGGETWIGTSGGLYRVEGGRPRRVDLSPGNLRIRTILEDRDGNVWVGLDPGGLRRVSPRYAELTRDADLVSDVVTALLEDREGNLWVGFSGSGLVKLSDGRATGLRIPDKEKSTPVLPIIDDGQGGAWVGTSCVGLAHVTPAGIRIFDSDSGLGNLCVWSLLPAADGGLWIGTHGDGLYRMRPDEMIERSGGPSTMERVVRALAYDEDGRVLVGTDQGLFRHDPRDGGFTPVDGTEGADVYFVDQAEDGSVWVGTRKGALILRRTGRELLDRSTGLSNDYVRAIHREPNGVVWLGTYGGGLNRLEGGEITVFDTRRGMPEDVVSRIIEDSSGRFWLTGNFGVTRVDKQELEEAARDPKMQLTAELFNVRDGMPVSETNGGGQPAGAILEDGSLWVPTVDGVAIFDTAREITNVLPPPVRIEEVFVDGEQLDLSRDVTLPAGARNLEIHYTALSFRSPERVRFRYRLEGFDERWIEAGKRRVAYYPVIPAGNLTFHVIACNDDGVWNEDGALFEFEMKPRFVETPLFFALCAVLTGLLVAGAARLRGIAVTRGRENLQRQVEVRTAELAKLAELTQHINEAVTLEEVLDHVYDSLRSIIPYDRIGLALLDENRVVLRAVWSRSESDTVEIAKGYEAPLEGSSLMNVLESGEPRVITDLEAYLEDHPSSESTRRIVSEGIRSSMTCPLKALGRPVGFLFFSSFKKDTYRSTHVRLLQQIAGHLSLVVGKSKLYEDLLETKSRLEVANRNLEALAAADGLTGIANRRSFDMRFEEEWRRAIRARTSLSLLMIDVDFFKPYNDQYGHTVGDDCLRTVATVLSANLRRVADMVARFGGEEFAVILPETDDQSARMMAERLRKGVEGLRMQHETSLVAEVVTISVGSATILPTTDLEMSVLIQAADAALYEAKRTGRNCSVHRTVGGQKPD